jgi:hypothetical protein
MFRINLNDSLQSRAHRSQGISLPRILLAVATGVVAFFLWACSSNNFRGAGSENPQRPSPDSGAETSPPENGDQQQAPPRNDSSPDPRRTVVLQVMGLQPEAWWNNCLKVELGGKSFDIACTKESSVVGKVVRIPIPDGVNCPVLNLKIESFVNVGSECAERRQAGQPCNGPFESAPRYVRSYDKSADRVHFVLTEAAQSGGGKLIRVHFEDQPTESITMAKTDPSRTRDLGIDFNDAVFDIKTLELPFEIQGAAGTKCR